MLSAVDIMVCEQADKKSFRNNGNEINRLETKVSLFLTLSASKYVPRMVMTYSNFIS